MKYFILSTLDTLFPNPKPSLTGWSTPFQLLIAILLSGNSTDKAVNSLTPRLFREAPDAFTMARLPLNTLYELIAPCGLGQRKSLYIHHLATLLLEKFHGEPPREMGLLMQLSGVGRKTASVFLSIIYQLPTFPVDTHILRLSHRWGISKKKSPLAAEKDLVAFFGDKVSPKLHLQLISYARKFCPALHHKIQHCPICLQISKHTKK